MIVYYGSTELVNAWLKNNNKFPKHNTIVSLN